MILSEQDKLALFVILKDTLMISDLSACVFCIASENRRILFEKILNQQDNSSFTSFKYDGVTCIPCREGK